LLRGGIHLRRRTEQELTFKIVGCVGIDPAKERWTLVNCTGTRYLLLLTNVSCVKQQRVLPFPWSSCGSCREWQQFELLSCTWGWDQSKSAAGTRQSFAPEVEHNTEQIKWTVNIAKRRRVLMFLNFMFSEIYTLFLQIISIRASLKLYLILSTKSKFSPVWLIERWRYR
jgi:hypothetical protein